MSTLAEPQLNATPLIDVLLVLLVMLVITLPMATHAVKLDMPRAAPRTDVQPPPLVTIDIDFDGRISWNGDALADPAALERHLLAAAHEPQPPRVKVVPDKRVRYEDVAVVLAAAQRSRIAQLDVATVPY